MNKFKYGAELLPLVFLLITIEAAFYLYKFKTYPVAATLSNIVVAIGYFISAFFRDLILAGVFHFFYMHRLFDIPAGNLFTNQNWPYLVLLFVLIDFLTYWMHRISHKIRWLWASHSVHHSSNEMYLSVFTRLQWTTLISSDWIFMIPVVIIGFTPMQLGLMFGSNLIFQFFSHTEMVYKIPILDKFLVTPSNHRVHHATNSIYFKKNYGSMTIIFDKIFGTYIEEQDGVKNVYGLLNPLKSNNPFIVVFHEWIAMAKDVKKSRTIKEAFLYCFGKPGWTPKDKKDTF